MLHTCNLLLIKVVIVGLKKKERSLFRNLEFLFYEFIFADYQQSSFFRLF